VSCWTLGIMRRQTRDGRPSLTAWVRRSRKSRLRLPCWRQTRKESKAPWRWMIRLFKAICVLGGTALAGATFWYGYDGYLDNKCMTAMQNWSNLVDLLDYCDQVSTFRSIFARRRILKLLQEPNTHDRRELALTGEALHARR
jgi:hypothetical protein